MRSIDFDPDAFPSGLETTSTGLPANGQLTLWEALRLVVLFEGYAAFGGRGDLIKAARYFKGARGDAIRNAYDATYKGKKLEDFRTAVKRRVGNRCPSCGGSRPSQLDHHLPKADYPEYALLASNLVPACPECNNTKSTTVGQGAETAFLHPYFDVIPPVPFITVTLDLEDRYVLGVVAFDDDAPIADAMLKTRMKHQFDTIDVNAKLESEITELILETGSDIALAGDDQTPETVAAYLTADAARKASFYGAGAWQAAVLRALAADAAYCAGGYLATRKTNVP